MLSTELGGMQQNFYNYYQALARQKISVLNIIHPFAKIKKYLDDDEALSNRLFNINQYDPIAIAKLRKYILSYRPSAIIIHGNRAAQLVQKAVSKINYKIPLIGVCHNRNNKKLIGLDYLFIILQRQRKILLEQGQPPKTIYHINNMIEYNKNMTRLRSRNFRDIPVIATMSRMVNDKSCDILINAAKILKERNIPFKLVIAGQGNLEKSLKLLAKQNDLSHKISFVGWVDDKEAFFKEIDIFCATTKNNHYGMSILEAMRFNKAIIINDKFNINEIITDKKEGVVISENNPQILADTISELIDNQLMAKQYAKNAFNKFVKNFTLTHTAEKLESALVEILDKHNNESKKYLHASAKVRVKN